jgi:hypothetical protein
MTKDGSIQALDLVRETIKLRPVSSKVSDNDGRKVSHL